MQKNPQIWQVLIFSDLPEKSPAQRELSFQILPKVVDENKVRRISCEERVRVFLTLTGLGWILV